jgi:hypothetical protein
MARYLPSFGAQTTNDELGSMVPGAMRHESVGRQKPESGGLFEVACANAAACAACERDLE